MTVLRIAFDATAIPMHRTGAGNYIFNLVRALAALDAENEYIIFAKRAHIDEFAISQPNIRFVTADLTNRGTRLVWEQTGLPQYVHHLNADILHSPHYTMPLAKVCRSVVTFCDTTFQLLPEMHSRSKRLFFGGMMRWSAAHADRLIAISESTRDDVIRLFDVEPERIVTTQLGASADYQPLPLDEIRRVCAAHNLAPDGYLLYVGVLEPRKNVPQLIEAYARIAADFPNVPLVIAGKKGWMYDAIFRRVQELGLEGRVRFLGHVPLTELVALYGGARAFVYPSRYEGFGLPVLEAMQSGVAVVTTNVSSMPEVAGDAALLVSPDDVPGLAAALRRLLDNAVLARTLSQRGLQRAKQFSWRRCAEETLRVYQSLD